DPPQHASVHFGQLRLGSLVAQAKPAHGMTSGSGAVPVPLPLPPAGNRPLVLAPSQSSKLTRLDLSCGAAAPLVSVRWNFSAIASNAVMPGPPSPSRLHPVAIASSRCAS